MDEGGEKNDRKGRHPSHISRIFVPRANARGSENKKKKKRAKGPKIQALLLLVREKVPRWEKKRKKKSASRRRLTAILAQQKKKKKGKLKLREKADALCDAKTFWFLPL